MAKRIFLYYLGRMCWRLGKVMQVPGDKLETRGLSWWDANCWCLLCCKRNKYKELYGGIAGAGYVASEEGGIYKTTRTRHGYMSGNHDVKLEKALREGIK